MSGDSVAPPRGCVYDVTLDLLVALWGAYVARGSSVSEVSREIRFAKF